MWISGNKIKPFESTVVLHIVSFLKKFSQKNVSSLGKRLKFVATIWIFYNLQIQKRIVSAETMW